MTKQLQKLRCLAAALCLAASLMAGAYDFRVDGICYDINSDGKSVTVTYQQEPTSSNGYKAYYNASGSLVIPSSVYYNGRNYSVTCIGEKAFYGCSGFTGSLTIPNSVTEICSGAFYGCTGFNGSLTIGKAVTKIAGHKYIEYNVWYSNSDEGWTQSTYHDYCAFCGCYGFKELIFNANHCNNFEYKCHYMFDNYRYTEEHYSELTGYYIEYIDVYENSNNYDYSPFHDCTSIEKITIGENVQYIPNNFLCGLRLTNPLIIPESVTYIGGGAFQDCQMSSLIFNSKKSADFGYNSNYYGYEYEYDYSQVPPFFGCSIEKVIAEKAQCIPSYFAYEIKTIKTVELGENVNRIGENAFAGCNNIANIICHRNRPAAIDNEYAFESRVYDNATVHVPNGSLSYYYTAPVWIRFEHYIDDAGSVVVKGDLTGDGRVDIDDVNAVVNLILGRTTLYSDRADTNADGKVNVADLNSVINAMLGR